jgi:hypothetical protein
MENSSSAVSGCQVVEDVVDDAAVVDDQQGDEVQLGAGHPARQRLAEPEFLAGKADVDARGGVAQDDAGKADAAALGVGERPPVDVGIAAEGLGKGLAEHVQRVRLQPVAPDPAAVAGCDPHRKEALAARVGPGEPVRRVAAAQGRPVGGLHARASGRGRARGKALRRRFGCSVPTRRREAAGRCRPCKASRKMLDGWRSPARHGPQPQAADHDFAGTRPPQTHVADGSARLLGRVERPGHLRLTRRDDGRPQRPAQRRPGIACGHPFGLACIGSHGRTRRLDPGAVDGGHALGGLGQASLGFAQRRRVRLQTVHDVDGAAHGRLGGRSQDAVGRAGARQLDAFCVPDALPAGSCRLDWLGARSLRGGGGPVYPQVGPGGGRVGGDGSRRAMAPPGSPGLRRSGSGFAGGPGGGGSNCLAGLARPDGVARRGAIRSLADTGWEACDSRRSAWRKNRSRSTMATSGRDVRLVRFVATGGGPQPGAVQRHGDDEETISLIAWLIAAGP